MLNFNLSNSFIEDITKCHICYEKYDYKNMLPILTECKYLIVINKIEYI